MWAYADKSGKMVLRHQCQESDGLARWHLTLILTLMAKPEPNPNGLTLMARYGWHRHDGAMFGEQTIDDGALQLNTSFVKQPADAGSQQPVLTPCAANCCQPQHSVLTPSCLLPSAL